MPLSLAFIRCPQSLSYSPVHLLLLIDHLLLLLLLLLHLLLLLLLLVLRVGVQVPCLWRMLLVVEMIRLLTLQVRRMFMPLYVALRRSR